MFDKIDFKKSINSKRLIFKKGWFSRFTDNAVWIFMIIAFPVISLSMLYGSIKFNWIHDSLPQVLIMQFVGLGLSSFMIFRLSTMDRLVVAKGVIDNNRQWIQEICKELKYGIVTDNKKCLVAVLKPGLFAWHRYLYVIYDNDKVLINCITYGLHGLKSPFHRMIDKRIINKITTGLENKVRRHNNMYSA
jgi:hypothetical protein